MSESVWETERERECLNWETEWTERLSERVFESVRLIYCADFESYKLDFYVAKFRPPRKFVHVSVLTNQAKRVLKAWVLIGSWVLETRDANFSYSFKTRQQTKLLA